jgi:hypothetical protein
MLKTHTGSDEIPMLAYSVNSNSTAPPSYMKFLLRKQDPKRAPRSRARGLMGFVLLAVLGLNLILAPHEYDLKLHQAGEHCVTCDLLHASGHGVAPTALSLPPASTENWSTCFYVSSAPFLCRVYRARGPPSSSHV